MSEDRPQPLGGECAQHALIALLVAAAVAACYFSVDRPVALWAHGLAPGVAAAAHAMSAPGSSAPYLIGFALAYAILRLAAHRPLLAQRALYLFAAVAVSGLAADLAKDAFARWRPIALFTAKAHYGFALWHGGYKHASFPSGHATTAGALALALTLLAPRWRLLWLALAALVAAGRVLGGAHFPGDVVAGLWLGAVVALALSRSRWFRGAIPQPTGLPGPPRV
ncbi:MAG TPA: phosphatase PAP2 family protein [bacterium]